MNESRVKALIDAYGAEAARWPADERASAEALCASSPFLQSYRNNAARLDGALDAHRVQPALSVDDLLATLDAQPAASVAVDNSPAWLDALMTWLFPGELIQVWRPALAAVVPVLAGVYVGAAGVILPDDSDWSTSEQYLFAPYETAANGDEQ